MYEKVKKVFALSDVHGFYTPMMRALDEAGFQPDNGEQLLVFCGDMFDRGNENLSVLRYMTGLKNAVLIRGNHDERLNELLSTCRLTSSDLHNKTDETLTEFFGVGCIDGNLKLHITDDALAERLRALYRTERDYFEIGDYVFTHGWLPTEIYDGTPYLREHWYYADAKAWHAARWLEWQQLYPKRETAAIPGKTVVCGHRPASFGYLFDKARAGYDYGTFYGDGVIAIDGWTARSGLVNVLTLDMPAANGI